MLGLDSSSADTGPTIIPYPNEVVLKVGSGGGLSWEVNPGGSNSGTFSSGGDVPRDVRLDATNRRTNRKTTLTGVLLSGAGGPKFRGTLTDSEEFRLRVVGPEGVTLMVDGRTAEGVTRLPAGSYQIELTGRPR